MRPGYLGDITHRKRGLRFEKKQWVEFLPRAKKVDFQSWARPDDFVRYGRCKSSQHRKIVSLSLLMSKPLKSNKSFVPELRSRKVLSFGFPMSISHIRVSWVCYTFPRGICPKMNVITRLEYELAYYDSTVYRFNHYTTRTPPYTYCNLNLVSKFGSCTHSIGEKNPSEMTFLILYLSALKIHHFLHINVNWRQWQNVLFPHHIVLLYERDDRPEKRENILTGSLLIQTNSAFGKDKKKQA